MQSNNKLAIRLKEYRKANGWTQEQLAERLGISLVYYGELERGVKLPAVKTLLSFCEEMNCSLDELTNLASDERRLNAEAKLAIDEINTILKQSSPEAVITYRDVISSIGSLLKSNE